jgi:trk system potassium uptake protein TrkH
MNLRAVAWYSAWLLTLVAGLLLLPAGLAFYDGDMHAFEAYVASFAFAAALAYGLLRLGKSAPSTLHRKDALGVVSAIWLMIGVVGALPMLFEGAFSDPVDAFFEAVSGFTTVGATVATDVDGLSRATNLWRCLMHWIGGMGIVVLFVAIFPQLGVGAKQLFRNEVAGPITEGLRPRIKQTALALWWIYAALTALATGLLWLAGMPIYDAVCHAFSTLSTGGFSTKSQSVGAFNSEAIDWIICAFMCIGGLNFALFHAAARGQPMALFRNYELRFYLGVNLLVIGIVCLGIQGRHDGLLETLRYATFQTLSVTTTSGLMTEDYDSYPEIARYALFLCMFMGGCAGSTAGGIKASRVYALIKLALRELRMSIQPQAVVAVRAGGQVIPPAVLDGILVFVVAYFTLFALASAVMVALGMDMVSAMSGVVACLSTVGPGLGTVGPTQNYAFLPDAGKLVLALCMIAGRLEIFALFAVLHPESWRR